MWFWYGLLLVVLGCLVLRCTTYSSSDDSSSEELDRMMIFFLEIVV